MGKKAKAKEFRRLAAGLPELKQESIEKSVVSADKLLQAGISKFSDGSPVELGKNYVKTDMVYTNVNHARRLRKHAAKFGQAGVVGYIRSVKKFVQENKDNGK